MRGVKLALGTYHHDLICKISMHGIERPCKNKNTTTQDDRKQNRSKSRPNEVQDKIEVSRDHETKR